MPSSGYEALAQEIEEARNTLRLSETDPHILPDEEGTKVYKTAEQRFVTMPGRTWWWEAFRFPATSVYFDDGKGWERLTQLVPSASEKVWFIVGEDGSRYGPVYETSTEVVQQVLGECYPFEYYLVAKDFSWLIGENHHDVMFAIGELVEANLKLYSSPDLL
jgi:hypothetical protein